MLNDGARQFLSGHHRVLSLLSVGWWVKFTEQYTFAPRLYEKIAGAPPERKQERYRSFLTTVQGMRCFYCGLETTTLHIDHAVLVVRVGGSHLETGSVVARLQLREKGPNTG